MAVIISYKVCQKPQRKETNMVKRKTHYQVKGVKLKAVKDAKERFLDIVEYKKQHKKDLDKGNKCR